MFGYILSAAPPVPKLTICMLLKYYLAWNALNIFNLPERSIWTVPPTLNSSKKTVIINSYRSMI